MAFDWKSLGDSLGSIVDKGLEIGKEINEQKIETIKARNAGAASVGVSQTPTAVNADGAPVVQPRASMVGVSKTTLILGAVVLTLGAGAFYIAKN